MNERFNDLRLDAGISRLHEVPYMVAVNKEGEIIEPLDGLQKFAELIIRECSKVIRNGGYRRGAFGNEDLRPSEIATMIEEHFGIEE